MLRHSDHFPNLEHIDFSCTHKRKDFRCHEISKDDIIKEIRNNFFKTKNKNLQDNKLGNFIAIDKPRRVRNRKPEKRYPIILL